MPFTIAGRASARPDKGYTTAWDTIAKPATFPFRRGTFLSIGLAANHNLVVVRRQGGAAPGQLPSRACSPSGTEGLQTHRWSKADSNLYGAFPVKRLFCVVLKFFVRSGKGRFSFRRLGSGSRSARKGSRDRNGSKAWRLAALAALVFRSALTPEHAERR